MAQQETRVEYAPAGNGTARPYWARLNGELLRTKNGVGRRFKTEAAARKALNAAQGRPDPDKPLTTNQMVAMFAEVLATARLNPITRGTT